MTTVVLAIVAMRTTRALLAMMCIVLLGWSDVSAQTESPASDDVQWLTAVVKPVFDYASMTHRWSADSSAVIFENIMVDWMEGADTTASVLRGKRIQRAINCIPTGTLVDASGDSVVVNPAAARIVQVLLSGTIGLYKMVLPVSDARGKPLAEQPKGQITITISAGKVIDRRYSVEMTRQTVVEL